MASPCHSWLARSQSFILPTLLSHHRKCIVEGIRGEKEMKRGRRKMSGFEGWGPRQADPQHLGPASFSPPYPTTATMGMSLEGGGALQYNYLHCSHRFINKIVKIFYKNVCKLLAYIHLCHHDPGCWKPSIHDGEMLVSHRAKSYMIEKSIPEPKHTCQCDCSFLP